MSDAGFGGVRLDGQMVRTWARLADESTFPRSDAEAGATDGDGVCAEDPHLRQMASKVVAELRGIL